MSLWYKVRGMMGDDPPYLAVGTEVSAKYKGAFCEAKVRKVVRSVKCKVTFKQGLGTVTVTDDHIRGTLRVGAVCEVKHPEKKEIIEATISKIQDCSQYTVVFDDGDITTLRRSALCLKSGRHFAESETLDQLPLTHPEHFGNPVIGGRKGRRSRQTQDDSSDDETVPKKGKKKEEKEADIGKVVCVELGDKKKQKDNWFPGLVVAPTAQDTVRIRVKDEYLVRSFKDGRYFTVPKKEATSFTREIGNKVDNNTLKTAVEKALQYLDRDDLPPHWDRDLLFGIAESSANSDGLDSDSSDDEPREEKDHFVAQLYKFMDDRGTPINKGPTIGTRDVDLYKLFKVVDKLGGYNRVTNHNQWKTISHKLGFGQNSSSITNLVKQAYKKFLHSFEDFYRKLGCTMVNHPRGDRSRHRSGRSLIRDRDRATPVNTLKEKDKDKQLPTTSGQAADKVEVECVEKKELPKPEEEKKDKQEDSSRLKDVKKEKIKVKEEKTETLTREERKIERLKSREETLTLPVSDKQKKKDEKSKAVEVLKEKIDDKEDKKAKKEDKMKDKELKGKMVDDESVEVETENKTKSKGKKEEKSKSASERTRLKDEDRFKLLDDKKPTEEKNKLTDDRSKQEEKRSVEEKSRFSEGKTKLTEAKKKPNEARNKKSNEDKTKHFDSKKSSELYAKESKSKSETKGKVADDKSKVSDTKLKPEDKGKITELKTRSDDKSKLQDEKLNLTESKNKVNEEKKIGEEKVKSFEQKIKPSESKIKEQKVETKSKPEAKCEEKIKSGDEKQKQPVGNMEEMDNNLEKDNCEKRVDNDKQFTRSRSKEDQRLKKEQPTVSEQRCRNRESKTPVRETADKKPPPRKKEDMVFVLKKRGRKRKDTETKIEEGLGQVANNVNIVIGDKLKVYYGPTQESKVTYEAKVLDIEEDGLDRMYLVHYTGWNTRYDEWIKRSRIADSLSWSPSRAKRLRQQEAQLKASKQSGNRRGRPSRDSVPPPRPRSATPSSVTSSSSRTKSPAGSNHGKNQCSSRGGRGRALFRRRTRRTSGHTDISLASETDTEEFESEVEVEPEPEVELSRLRSGNEKRSAAVEKDDSSKEGLAKDDDVKEDKVLRQKAMIKKEAVDVSSSSTQEEEEDAEVQDDFKDESLDQSTELDTSSEVLVFETRRSTRSRRSCASMYERKDSSLKQYVTKSETGTESDDDQPKGRDFDLNEIRSELKGIEKAVKVPQKAVGGSDIKGEGNLEDLKNVENEDTFPCKEIKVEPPTVSKLSMKEEEVVEDVYEFKEPEPFEFEVRPKKDFDDRSPKITRRHVGRIFDDQNVEKDEVVQCEGNMKQLKRAACQLFDSDEMSEDKTDSDNAESEVKTKFAKRFALSAFDNLEDKSSKFGLNEIVDRPGIEIKVCHNMSSDIRSDNRLSEEIKEAEKSDAVNSNISEVIQPKDMMTLVHATDDTGFGKKSPKDTLPDDLMQKNEQVSIIFEDFKYVSKVDKKDVDLVEKPPVIVEKSIGGIFEDEVCTLGQPDNELVIESDKDLRHTSVKVFEDEGIKTETVVTEVLSDKLVSTSCQLVFEDSSTNDNLPPELVVPKIPGVQKEITDVEESVTPINSEPETKDKSNQNIKKSGKKILDSSKSPRKKIVREPDSKAITPEKKVRRSGGKKTEEAVLLDSTGSSRNRPLSACEEAFDKLCESPSFRLVSKRSPTPAELEPLNIFTENTQEDEEDRLIIPDDIGIGEPLFSYPRSHEELFPTLVEPQKKMDSSSVPGEFQFSNTDSEKDMSHPIDFQLKSEEVPGDKVAPILHFNISVEQTVKVTDQVEVGKDAEMHLSKKNDCLLDEELKVKEQEEDLIGCVESVLQVTQQPILEVTDDIFGKLAKREPAVLPIRFTGTDSSDTDSSDEGPRLVIAPEDEEFSQLTPSQEELQETVVDDVSTSEIVLEEIKVGPLAEVEDQVQQEVEVEVVDESQDRVKLTDEESVLDELESGPIVVKVDLSSAEKVDNTETEQGPVVELKISEEETTVCVVETTEASECEVLGSLLCQETIPGSPAATPQPAAEETAAPAVEMPFASAPGSSPGPRPVPEPAPVPGASGKSHAAPVLDNTPPTTPDSSMSTLSDERGGMSPTLDNESSKSHRDSFEIDLDSCVEGAKVDHFSEDDSLVNVEVSCSSDTRLRTQKAACVKESLPKKRRRSRRRSEGEPNKRLRQSSGRSPRSSTHNGCASDSDDMSESSTTGCVLENSISSRSPRPSKYNFYVELDPELDCSQRIALLQQKLQELRKTYMNIKAELACIDRRRKKLRRREREAEKATKQEVTCS